MRKEVKESPPKKKNTGNNKKTKNKDVGYQENALQEDGVIDLGES